MFLESELLPLVTSFLFVFALVYALLVYSKLFPESRNAAALISLVIAFFAVMYSPFVSYMQSFLPLVALLLVLLFFIVLVKRLLIEKAEIKDAWPAVVMLAAVLLVVGLLWDKIALSVPGITSENLLWIIGIFIIILIFIAVYKHEKSP